MSRKEVIYFLSFCMSGVFLLSCGGDNVFKSIAEKDSQEACRYEVAKNLDSGNWDAVLNSSCADRLQRGAAYFGKAGFDIKDVINRLIDSLDESKDLNIYLKALVPKVDEQVLDYLLKAKNEYNSVPNTDPLHKDAQFYLSLVDTAYALSLVKTVIDVSGVGTISDCDINNNNVPDEADATSCALLVSGSSNPTAGSCSPIPSANYNATSSDITFPGKDGLYRGLEITLTGSSGTCPTKYKKLLYKGNDGNYYVATTSGECTASDNNNWPCPIVQTLDFVGAIDQSLDSAVNYLNTVFPGLKIDVVDAINEIRQNACGNNQCTAQEIADYIQNYLSK